MTNWSMELNVTPDDDFAYTSEPLECIITDIIEGSDSYEVHMTVKGEK